jgi:DNA-binding NarL/FixJ family response regulator
VRVVIADDSVLVREGIASILVRAGIDVAAQVDSPDDLLREVDTHVPDVAIVDVRMPPTQTDEGLRAAHEIRARHPQIGIVILSQHVEVGIATRLLAETPEGLGYLLKDRVSNVDSFVGALERVADGGSALDPEVVTGLFARAQHDGPLQTLTERERQVLEQIAEGLSNQAIASEMDITLRSVEKYVSSVFTKLGLPATGHEHRRVLAVLRFLHA